MIDGSWLGEVAAGQHPGAKQAQKRAKQVVEAQKEAGQLAFSLFDDEFRQTTSNALVSIAAIERNPGITIEDVKAQETTYEELRLRFSEKYLYLANLGAALYYDLDISSDLWRPLVDYALGKSTLHPQSPQFDLWLNEAIAIAGTGEGSDATLTFGQRRPAPRRRVARADCAYRYLEDAGARPSHGAAPQCRWRRTRGHNRARGRAKSRFRLPDRIL